MKIAYFINTENSVNWGGQASTAGLKFLIKKKYPESEIVPLDFGPLPYRHATFMRFFLNKRISKAILKDDLEDLCDCLQIMNVDLIKLQGFDAVCFNGEGAVHSKSGHLYRLLGVLYYFIKKGVHVSSLNQTVDLGANEQAISVLSKVYSAANYVAVREPVSQRELRDIGVYSELKGDAAYAVPLLSNVELSQRAERYALPDHFVCITGSSIFGKSRSSARMVSVLLDVICKKYKNIYFLANTKTDLYIARLLSEHYNIKIIDYNSANYLDAMSVIALSSLLIGGRQHPNIFAAMYGTPFIPLSGNTHKMEGVVELLNYPIPSLAWDEVDVIAEYVEKIIKKEIDFSRVKVPCVDTINLG